MPELKKFRLKCSLIEKATRKDTGVRTIIIEGYYGNDAVSRFKDELAKEGIYELDDSYSYFEVTQPTII